MKQVTTQEITMFIHILYNNGENENLANYKMNESMTSDKNV